MLDQFFLAVNQMMSGGLLVAALGSFLWGLVSVLFSPCHLASIPLIVGYVAGQSRLVEGRQAAGYAGLFSLGLFISIAIVGVLCAALGRMLGDVGPWWTIPVGGLLVWLGLDMLGVATCALPGKGALGQLRLRGAGGALVLGLAYGVLSGACTFGFIAPLLAIIAVQGKVAEGMALIGLFALGHCLPIAVAGGSAGLVKKLLAQSAFQQTSQRFRQAAGVLVAGLGVYFILKPVLDI